MNIYLALLITCVTMFFSSKAFGQDVAGYRIEVDLENYDSDTLYLGYYYWDKQYLVDTAFRSEGGFVFEGADTLNSGMYLLVTLPNNDFAQMVMGEEDQRFEVKADAKDLASTMKIEGCNENQLFYHYLEFLGNARAFSVKIQEDKSLTEEQTNAAFKSLDEEVKRFQDSLVQAQPESMVAFVIKANQEVDIPEMTGELDEIRDRQYRYYVKHYFDHYDLSDERWIYTSFLHAKVDKYLKKVIVQIPDSINQALDLILGKAEPNEENYKRLLVHYLNEYANSDYVGMDAVYVHLVKNYYGKGKAPWVKEEQLTKMMDDATKMEPTLIGKPAPDITVNKRDGSSLRLYDIDSSYTVLLFWAPDCGYCKKKMPKLVQIAPEIKKRGAEIIAVCTKLMEKEATCWEYLDENNLTGLWVNTSDQYLRSRFKQKYNVVSTPQVYILDKDKTIVSKRIGVDQIVEVLDNIKSIQEAEK